MNETECNLLKSNKNHEYEISTAISSNLCLRQQNEHQLNPLKYLLLLLVLFFSFS